MNRIPPSPERSVHPSSAPTAVGRVATLILWLAALGCASVLAYGIAVPASRGSTVISFAFWYVLPATVGLVATLALRSSADRRLSVTLLLAVTFACAMTAEAVLRAFPRTVAGLSIPVAVADSICDGEFRRQAGCLAAAVRGLPFDRRTTLEVIEDYEADGIEAWPSIDATEFIDRSGVLQVSGRAVVPLSPGLPGVFTVFCNESGEWISYEADEYGFNNPPGSHEPGRADVALIGDSFVHGWCVPYEQTLMGRLGDLGLNAVGVAVEGSGPLMQLGQEIEYVAPLRPAVVVWVFYEGNDLDDLEAEKSNDVLMRYLDPGFRQGLRESQDSLDRAVHGHLEQLRRRAAARARTAEAQREASRGRRGSLLAWLRLAETRSRLAGLFQSSDRAQPYDSVLFGRIAERLRDDVAGWEGQLLFAYLPSRRRFDDGSKANPHRESILGQVGDLGIPALDLFEVLSRHPDPLSLFPFRLETHFTAEGFDLAAQALAAWIHGRDGDAALAARASVRAPGADSAGGGPIPGEVE